MSELATTTIDPADPHAQRSYAPLRAAATLLGIVGIVGLILGYMGVDFGLGHPDKEVFYRAYLVGCLLWLGVSLGSLFYTMVHNLTGGAWGKIIRRPAESAIACIPVMGLLFIPLLFGLPYLFEWAQPDMVAKDRILQHKSGFLNPSFVTIRTVAYFAIWSTLAIYLFRRGRQLRAAGEGEVTHGAYNASAGGMVIHFFSVTLFIIDWVMSRDSHWYSSIIGFIFLASQGLMAMSFLLIVVCWRYARADDRMPVDRMTLNDLGTMMMANTVFWTYVSIAQLVILYSGNTSHGNTWYIQRGFGRDMENGWKYVAAALLVFAFLTPFVLLLMRDLKQRMRFLLPIACLVFFMRGVDMLWWVVPSGAHVDEPGFHPHVVTYVEIAAMLAIGGVWVNAFFYFLSGGPVLTPAATGNHGIEHGPHGPQVFSHAGQPTPGIG